MPERKRNQLIARTAATITIALRRVWAPQGGNASGVEVGVILTEVFYTANPWVTAQYVTDRLAGVYSTDTVRRRLEEMVDAQTVELIETGGRKLYRAGPGAAGATVEAFLDGCATLNV